MTANDCVQPDATIELFIQSERAAADKAEVLRESGLTVQVTNYVGGCVLTVSGPLAVIEKLAREDAAEREVYGPGPLLTGTVRWWREEKGYGRITGDDGYVYFCHFSGLKMEGGYKNLRKGQRVEFERGHGVADHGRAVADNVRVISDS